MNNNKCLFVNFMPIKEGRGISQKIIAQTEALSSYGLEVSYSRMTEENGYRYYFIGNEKVEDLGRGAVAKIAFFCKYGGLLKYVKENGIKFVYIRYILTANPFFINFLKRLKKAGTVVFLEIPTYPYDEEFGNSLKYRFQKTVEHYYRKKFKHYIDRIVTFSLHNEIYGVKTIMLSNSVDMEKIPLRNPQPHRGFVMMGVANISFWHGYDRLIRSMAKYYQNGGEDDVQLYIIGGGDKYLTEYKDIVKENNLEEYVHFEGIKNGEELNPYFDMSDIAVGCLACHRKGIKEVKSLKNVEYAARGIPFIYSEDNSDFDKMKYVRKESPDESLLNIDDIINFARNVKYKPNKIRETVEKNFTWVTQMRKVVETFKTVNNM